MYKLVVLYRPSELTPDEFSARYAEHMALINQVPGLRKTEVSRFAAAPWGAPDLMQLAELWFDDRAALEAAMASPEMAAAGKQLRSFARGTFTMYYAEVQ